MLIDFSLSPKKRKDYLCFNYDQVGLGWLLIIFVFIFLGTISFYSFPYVCFQSLAIRVPIFISSFIPITVLLTFSHFYCSLTTSLSLSNWLQANVFSIWRCTPLIIIIISIVWFIIASLKLPIFLCSPQKKFICHCNSLVWGKGDFLLIVAGIHIWIELQSKPRTHISWLLKSTAIHLALFP